ncbi:MAG: hypothetical protein U0872_04760 [Planctomycetaceae bacterium]
MSRASVSVISPQHFLDEVIAKTSWPAMRAARGLYVRQPVAQGPRRRRKRLGLGRRRDDVADQTDGQYHRTGARIDGLTFEFQMTPGSERAEMHLYVPELKPLPRGKCDAYDANLYTRGRATPRVVGVPTDHRTLATTDVLPALGVGQERIVRHLTRNGPLQVHSDQTLRLANQATT